MRPAFRLQLLLLALFAVGCASRTAVEPKTSSVAPPAASLLEQDAAAAPRLDTLYSTLWLRTAVEYRASALQAYGAARAALDAGLADPSWTAATEQQGSDFQALPPAIVLDVDETVLDNSLYQVEVIEQSRRYDTESWNHWCERRMAEPIPGARELTQYAASRGVAVYYVTNRRAVVQQATCDNLRSKGFPVTQDCATVMTRGLRPEWDTSDKGPRRREIAAKHRIVLLIGDDLGDFLSGNRVSTAERDKVTAPFESWWGRRWIMIPNPIYGSWADALLDFNFERTEAEALELRRKALRQPREIDKE